MRSAISTAPGFATFGQRIQVPLEDTAVYDWAGPDGDAFILVYRRANVYLVRFPKLGDFTISFDGLDVAAYPAPGVSSQTIEHLYLNQVLPLALSRQFKLVLHAAAVEIEGFCLAFTGFSGRGKSTLAASFATNGYRFLTDDGLQLEKYDDYYLAKPSHPSIRLWDDSGAALMPLATQTAPSLDYTPKSRFLAGTEVAFCETPRTLKGIYFLGSGETDVVSIEPIGGREVMIELVRHSFLLDMEEREMLTHHFDRLAELARMPMFFRLDYPRHYGQLQAVREAIIRHATGFV